MIDNTLKIRSLLKFENKDDFYYIQILQRKKENPELKSVSVIAEYYVYSYEYFYKIIPDIITLCELKNSRAYIRMNRRNAKKVALHMLKTVTDLILSEHYSSVKSAYASTVGSFHSDQDKTWLIDYDDKDIDNLNLLVDKLKECQVLAKKEPMVEVIPTKNGYHIITRPFDPRGLSELQKSIPCDIHKDNPTVLYI